MKFDMSTVLYTERLCIRPFCEADKEAMYQLRSNPEMFKYTPDGPWSSIADAEEFLRLAQRLYQLDHPTFRHFFAVTQRYTGSLIGYCGIGGIAYDRTQNEVFYGIAPEHWRKGYAFEAGRAMLEYGFRQLGLPKLIAAVQKENIASIKVLEKLGLIENGILDGLPEETFNGQYLYALHQCEYLTETP